MRLIFLTLLLVVAVDGGLLSKVVSGAKHFGEKFKNVTVTGYRKLSNSTTFLKVREKLRNMNEKVMATLRQTPERVRALMEKLKNIKTWFFKRDTINPEGDSIEQINNNTGVNEDLYQTDIVLTEEQANEVTEGLEDEVARMNSTTNSTFSRKKRQAFKDRNYPGTIWSEGVRYYFHAFADRKVRSVFLKAIKLWEKDTCINFVEDRNADARVRVTAEQGCWSIIGRIGKEQKISLGRNCEVVAIAAHEIGHTLGLFHTHARYDRDEYIDVIQNYVKVNFLRDFNKETPAMIDNYGRKYDYGSIMHYGGSTGSFYPEKKPTIVPKKALFQQTLGSPFISFIDLLILNQHYNCLEKCDPKKSAKCQMGGFPNPRNCNKCVCPGGYGGDLCNERPSGCGRTIQASADWERLEDVTGAGDDTKEDFLTCNYWIESPRGTEIEVKLIDYEKGVSVDGCKFAGVEIKTNRDQTLTGYRFCAAEAAGTTLRSYTNRVPIMTWSRVWASKTVLEYRYVSATSDRLKPSPDVEPPKTSPTTSKPSVTPLPSVVNRPTTPKPIKRSSDSPVITGSGFKCVDNHSCRVLKAQGFCDKMGVSAATRVKVCPKMCGFC